MPKVSVIIPVYNSEKYLRQCLDSVINQTLKDIEIICINDGSTDDSLQILEEYAKKDSRIKVINQKNKGVSTARNVGMQNSTAEFVTFIDDDDFIDNNTYECTLKYINKADLVCFGIEVFGKSNHAQKRSDEYYYKIKFKNLQKINKEQFLNTDVSVCNKIFKNSIIRKYNITFPDGLNYEDAEFFNKYVSCSKTAYYIDEYYYHYRRSNDSIMAATFKGSEKAIHHLFIVEHIFDFWVRNNYLAKNEDLFINIFNNYFNFAYWYSPIEHRNNVLSTATEYANKFQSELIKKNYKFIKNLIDKRYDKLLSPKLKFCQRIFSTVNSPDKSHKIIAILGFKIKIKRKQKNAKG